MILLDTNIIIDLVGTDERPEAQWSRRRYRELARSDTFGCNLIVLAEIAAQGEPASAVAEQLDRFQVEVVDLITDGAFAAGRAYRRYRQRGGRRDTILSDFLIAGHAEALGASLMTRDRRLATYFPTLTLITPETQP